MLTRQEKERLVIELYNQGKTIRDIAKELRISFRDIGAILKKASGEREEKQDIKESLSPSTQAYRLFSKGKLHLWTSSTSLGSEIILIFRLLFIMQNTSFVSKSEKVRSSDIAAKLEGCLVVSSVEQ